jgi:hypothetical protein
MDRRHFLKSLALALGAGATIGVKLPALANAIGEGSYGDILIKSVVGADFIYNPPAYAVYSHVPMSVNPKNIPRPAMKTEPAEISLTCQLDGEAWDTLAKAVKEKQARTFKAQLLGGHCLQFEAIVTQCSLDMFRGGTEEPGPLLVTLTFAVTNYFV